MKEVISGHVPRQVFAYKADGSTDIFSVRSGDRGTVETVFRYFRLVVERMSGGEGTIQFSKLQFKTPDGIDIFKYATGSGAITKYVTGKSNQGSPGSSGEEETSGILETGNKCCLVWLDIDWEQYDVNPPLVICYDLLSPRLDLSIYSKWHWYTSNDTDENQGRNMVKFRLDVSNTGVNWDDPADTTNWRTVDSADFTGNIPEAYSQSKVLAYTGTINGLED